jgi:hypothetical protein
MKALATPSQYHSKTKKPKTKNPAHIHQGVKKVVKKRMMK